MNWKFKVGFAAVLIGCLSALSFGATGDITQAIIDPNAFVAHIKISGEAPGGTYSFGTAPGSAKAVFTVVSKGFDSAGNATTKTRTLYATRQMLQPTGSGSIAMSAVQIGPVTGGGIFADGDSISQPSTGAAAVVDSNCPCSPLLIRNITGSPSSSGPWTDGTTGATATPTTAPTVYTGSPVREGVDGSDVWIAVSLSDFVYLKDNVGVGNSGTAPTVTIASGLYTNGTASNAVTGLVCTNESTLAYPSVIGQWCIEGGLPFSGALDLEMFGVHRSAANGQPLACVIFSAADSHAHTVTATVTAMAKSAAADATPVYKTTINASSFTQGDDVVCNWKAFPNVGDSGSVLDTSTGGAWPQFNASGAPSLGPINFKANAAGTYSQPVVVVDPKSTISGTASGTFANHDVLTQDNSGATCHVIGTQTSSPIKVSLIVGTPTAGDTWRRAGGESIAPSGLPVSLAAGGTVYADSNHTPGIGVGGSPGTYGSVSVAIANGVNYNNANNGRNNADGLIVYLLDGDYGTGDQTATTVSTTYCTVTRFPGVANGQARVVGYLSLNPYGPTLIKFKDLDVAPIDDEVFSDNWGVWVDGCRIDGTGAAGSLVTWEAARLTATYNTSANLNFPFIPFGGSNFPNLLRGNNFTGITASGSGQCVVGNTFDQASSANSQVASPGTGDGSLFAYNRVQAYGTAYIAQSTCTQGVAVCCNLFEILGTANPAGTSIFADGNTAASNNFLFIDNTVAGTRSNTGYNDELPPALRINFYFNSNSCFWLPVKTDTFNQTAASEGLNPTRIKNWSVYYGAGFLHNNSEDVTDNGSFAPAYFGIDGTRATAAGYTSDKSGTGGGNGNYVPAVGSTLIGRVPLADQAFTYDLAGNARGSTTAIGAFAAANEAAATGNQPRNNRINIGVRIGL